MKHNLIILLGIQGSGKGRLSEELRTLHDYNFIETGAIFRGLSNDNPVDAEIMKIMATGALVSDEMTERLVESRLGTDHDILTDGFPRTIPQAEWLMGWADAHDFSVQAICLNIPDEMVFARINNRVVVDGSMRPDDLDTESIKKRIASYHEKTEPMIHFLRHAPHVEFFDIDGTKTRPEVVEDVRKKVGL